MAGQPIIRGIQAVGSVGISYKYNSSDGMLKLPESIKIAGQTGISIDTSGGIEISGFRLDGEFLRAVQQIASSVQIPILGGGAVALTNNNRSGTLSINCTKVSTPAPSTEGGNVVGSMYKGNGIGPVGSANVYDLTFIAQIQQAQPGGDSVGATINVSFAFCGLNTVITFEGCTIVSVDPIALTGNDAAGYNVSINYLNWSMDTSQPASQQPTGGN